MLGYILMLPIYASIAAFSFRYFAVKSKVSANAVESFSSKLKFPFKTLFSGKKPLILWLLAGNKNTNLVEYLATVTLKHAQFQRRLLIIVSSSLVIPVLVSLFSLSKLSDSLNYIIYTFVSLLTIIACGRFGKSLASSV